jgi:inorganic pyrophosphatase
MLAKENNSILSCIRSWYAALASGVEIGSFQTSFQNLPGGDAGEHGMMIDCGTLLTTLGYVCANNSCTLMILDAGMHISSRSDDGLVHVVIDTPQGSRNKYKYEEALRCFKLSRVLPAGMSFPHDFGAIPCTAADDGDPLDVMVLVETPSFAGCLLKVRLIGVIEAKQVEKRHSIRNDRLIGVAVTPVNKPVIARLDDVPEVALLELEQFFVNYNRIQGREFKLTGRGGPRAAERLLKAGEQAYRRE